VEHGTQQGKTWVGGLVGAQMSEYEQWARTVGAPGKRTRGNNTLR